MSHGHIKSHTRTSSFLRGGGLYGSQETQEGEESSAEKAKESDQEAQDREAPQISARKNPVRRDFFILFPSVYSLLPISYSLFPTAYSLFPSIQLCPQEELNLYLRLSASIVLSRGIEPLF